MKDLPPIPETVEFPCGSIPVIQQQGFWESENCFGKWDWFERVIYVEATMGIVAMWLTLEHEKVHAIMSDAGIQINDDSLEEQICNAIAAARVAEMLR